MYNQVSQSHFLRVNYTYPRPNSPTTLLFLHSKTKMDPNQIPPLAASSPGSRIQLKSLAAWVTLEKSFNSPRPPRVKQMTTLGERAVVSTEEDHARTGSVALGPQKSLVNHVFYYSCCYYLCNQLSSPVHRGPLVAEAKACCIAPGLTPEALEVPLPAPPLLPSLTSLLLTHRTVKDMHFAF